MYKHSPCAFQIATAALLKCLVSVLRVPAAYASLTTLILGFSRPVCFCEWQIHCTLLEMFLLHGTPRKLTRLQYLGELSV
jgi:hypothetical protein